MTIRKPGRQEIRIWALAFVSFVVLVVIVVVLLAGCAGTQPLQSQETSVPIKVEAAEGSDVRVEAPVTSEQEQEESAIEAPTEAEIGAVETWTQHQQFETTRFGLDAGTLELLKGALSGVGAIVSKLLAVCSCIAVGAGLFFLCLPSPFTNQAYRAIAMAIAVGMVVIPIVLWAVL